MAKKNGRDDPPKPQVAENEQMSDIILILDKMELILQAVSQIDKDGRYKTVPADKEHTNSFLKIDRYASMFENFLKNFWGQSLLDGSGSIGVTGGVWSFSFDMKFFQKRVIVSFAKIIREPLPRIAG